MPRIRELEQPFSSLCQKALKLLAGQLVNLKPRTRWKVTAIHQQALPACVQYQNVWTIVFQTPGQAVSIVGTIAYSAIGTTIIILITKFITGGLRVEKDDEIIGLDNTIHGERAFELE